MSRELYQEVIIDHGTQPRNKGVIENTAYKADGFNPLCGDQISLSLEIKDNNIKDAKFEGEGCAISTASASLMTQFLKGKTIEEAKNISEDFIDMLTKNSEAHHEALGKLTVLAGVSEYPARVKCAALAWRTLEAALNHQATPVSTE